MGARFTRYTLEAEAAVVGRAIGSSCCGSASRGEERAHRVPIHNL